MVREAREAGLYEEKVQRFKNCPRIYITIISFFETERATLTQILSKEFYEKITPYAFVPRTCPTIPTSKRDKALFSEPDKVLSSQAISFIKVISDDEILVCLNGIESKVYRYNSKDNKRPFKKVFDEIATLKELSGHRLSCAGVASDYFVVSSD